MKKIDSYIKLILLIVSGLGLFFASACSDDDEPERKYTLTVNEGTGSGEYEAATVVNISANPAPDKQVFEAWTGDAQLVNDVNSATTTLVMPERDASVTATYTDITYTLTVENGTGSGLYVEGAVVEVEATVPDGQKFVAWTGDVTNLDDASLAKTNFTIGASDATITATFVDIKVLTVENGTGGGEYIEGDVVEISATIPSDKFFLEWTGDTDNVEDVTKAVTNFTVGTTDATVVATFGDIPNIATFLDGTWKIEEFYEKFGEDEEEKIESSANDAFRLTFSFDDKFETFSYDMILGAVLAVPNFNSDANSGVWTVDDLNSPSQITFDPGNNESIVDMVFVGGDMPMLTLSWTKPSNINGKPDRSYKMVLTPVE